MLKRIDEKKVERVVAPKGTTCYQFDSKMGFWGIPNISLEISNEYKPGESIQICHNSLGNRDCNVIISGNKLNIICLGGSHTWGGGVPQDIRYTEYLSSMSGQQIFNMGHCSLGLDQICLAILHKSSIYSPNIIVVEQYPWAVHRVLNSYVNGFIRPHFVLNKQGNLELRKVPSFAGNKIIRKIIGSYYSYRKELIEFKAGLNIKQNYDSEHDPIFLMWKTRHYDAMYVLVDKILEVMIGYCRQRNIKLVFCLGAVMQQLSFASQSNLIDYLLPRDRLVECLNNHDIPYIDMTASMMAGHIPNDPVIFPDGHINQKGHYIFAKTLHKDLLDRGWIN